MSTGRRVTSSTGREPKRPRILSARSETVRTESLRKIADATISSVSMLENQIAKLKSIGFCIVPIEPTDMMCRAAADGLTTRDSLRASIKEGAL